ncbi:hypothetical protein HMPREF9124_0493 [Oribacterium sp. oral taxon 108 str. F0425]|nr:hypothetical protein HMPREF9124_0493 [Oribacterium sp. oral taxon 108 str. F0425]
MFEALKKYFQRKGNTLSCYPFPRRMLFGDMLKGEFYTFFC